jgi:4-hydroxybenzoate polyprenyltransferase
MWSRGNRALTVLAMTHPMGVVVFGVCVLLLCLIAQRDAIDPGLCIRLTAAAMFAQATSGVINDILDLDLDRAAKPWRAFPAGLISRRGAWALAAALLALGVFAAALVSPVSFLLLVVGVAIGAAYSAGVKRTPFSWLPYLIAYPSLPVWVWVSTGDYRPSILAVYAIGAPLVVAIHMVNQLRDFDADGRLGVRGLVQTLGKERATATCQTLVAIAPFPLLLVSLQSPVSPALWAAAGAALIHWFMLLPMILRRVADPDPVHFRKMFRALQLSGPLLLGAWLLKV